MAEPAPPLRPGDRVQINARVIGTVTRVVDGHARVVERETFGRPVTWSIRCDAAIRVPPERPFDADADALGSYHEAIRAIGEDVKAGKPVPEFLLSEKR
ncbi:MAG TPA: hypothetical protein VKQ73_02075 [Stellaceae bacterium]|nr:hypothetical protein [Stellaceae bacterium]